MSILRDQTRIFVDTSTSPPASDASFALPDTARSATLLYVADRSARIVMDSGQAPLAGTAGVVYRKTRFGLFAAPVTFSGNYKSNSRVFEAVLLNPGAILQRREYVRVSTSLGVSVFALEYGKARANFTSNAGNISQGGMRIYSKENVSIGQQLKISFLLDDCVVGLTSIIKSKCPENTVGVEFVNIPDDFSKSVCLLVYRTQVAQNPNIGQDLNKSMSDVASRQDLTDADDYWAIFSNSARGAESAVVSNNHNDFNNIVFSSF